MASTLCQKLLTIFCQKVQIFLWFGPYDFVQISAAWGPNTYQIMDAETLDFQCPHQQWLHKMPDRKICALPLKFLRATIANADIGSLKSLNTVL